MDGADGSRIGQSESLQVWIEGGAECFKVAESRSQFHVCLVLDVEQDAEDGLGGACIVDDLFSEENIVQAIISDHGTGWFVVLHPFKEED